MLKPLSDSFKLTGKKRKQKISQEECTKKEINQEELRANERDKRVIRLFVMILFEYLKPHKNCFISGAFVASDPDNRLFKLLMNASHRKFRGTSHQLHNIINAN
jgi:hypothetical protein